MLGIYADVMQKHDPHKDRIRASISININQEKMIPCVHMPIILSHTQKSVLHRETRMYTYTESPPSFQWKSGKRGEWMQQSFGAASPENGNKTTGGRDFWMGKGERERSPVWA